LIIFRDFRFVSKQIFLFRLFRNGSETPKQTETNRKNLLLVSRNKPKINRNRLIFGLFRFEPKKKFICFEDTLALSTGTGLYDRSCGKSNSPAPLTGLAHYAETRKAKNSTRNRHFKSNQTCSVYVQTSDRTTPKNIPVPQNLA
jgi:hypothetical protein